MYILFNIKSRYTLSHVQYVLRYVHKLLEWGIKPIMIFDGSCLLSKKNTEVKRKEYQKLIFLIFKINS
jgi:hypothetical protein